MEDYEINYETLALIPVKNGTMVYELNDSFLVTKSPYQIMEDSCSYFGSSLSGRQNGSKNMLGSGYKVPIIVEETNEIIFFPSTSPAIKEKCEWISVNNIKSIEKKDKSTKIIFENNQQIIVDIPYLSIQNQVYRSTRLASILKKRNNR